MVAPDEISPIVFGAGAFNTIYNQEPELGDVADVLRHALDRGINAFDTAAYYGPSEPVLGEALQVIGTDPRYARDKYWLTSKAGRWEDNTFDFSEESIRRSLHRTLERLHTDHVDLLLIHDVEFRSLNDAVTAVKAAAALKQEGKARYIGISGYPLSVLQEVVEAAREHVGEPVDAVLSYCNLTLQNDLLLGYVDVFRRLGVRLLFNASPLSMSLLRSRTTHDFHPAKPELRARADEIGTRLRERGIELADVASQYAFAHWSGPTVIGLRSKQEIDAALENRRAALEHPQTELWEEIIRDFGDLHNYTWPSPPQ